jgi:FlaG protein
MSFEIGPLSPAPRPDGVPAGRPAAPAGAPGFGAALSAADAARVSVPGSPPAAVLDEVGAAATRAEELAAQRRELHFEHDAQTGRLVVQVRDLASGAVLRTIPPSHALDLLAGGD